MKGDRAIDALVAQHVMGLKVVLIPRVYDHDPVNYWVVMDDNNTILFNEQFPDGLVPHYSSSDSAVRTMEKEIFLRGLQTPYVHALLSECGVTGLQHSTGLWYVNIYDWWAIVLITPIQRCRAALTACGVKIPA